MINREWQEVTVVSFINGRDEYGQERQLGSTTRTVEMVYKIYSQNNVTDVRYVDITGIGITKDKNITDSNQVIVGDETFNVKYVIPSGKYNQILLQKA